MQLVTQGLRLFQIARIEPFSEPPVHWSQQFARLPHLALVGARGVRGSWQRGVPRILQKDTFLSSSCRRQSAQ
jgi:hypothetical protein